MLAEVGPSSGWGLVIALGCLLALSVAAAVIGRLPTAADSAVAVGRAVVQLTLVAAVIRVAFAHIWSAMLFVAVMLVVATATSAGRVDARRDAVWIGATLASGAAPVITVIFATGSTPVSPPSIVAICGIVIGGSMTACSLAIRRAFSCLRDQFGQAEAALALGFPSSDAIRLVIDHDRPDSLVPILDQTRTVGLVTLPGAFVGVLLGGGSTAQAAAAQLIVLAGLVAAETITVVVATRLVAARRVLSAELRSQLPPA